jgi:hypothetical protein
LLAPAVQFSDLVLAVHILAAIIAFGVTFSFPVFLFVGARQDPSAMPWFHRMQRSIGRRVINPGLLVVILAGIYLAAHLHQWHAFYVQWGIGASIVIGALEGSFMIPREGKLAELAERDLAAAAATPAAPPAGSGSGATFAWSPEYHAVLKRVAIGGALMNVIVIVTVFLMATHAGA